MEPGENCSAVKAKFDPENRRESFITVHNQTNEELDSFITWYFKRSNRRRIASVVIRLIAVVAGVVAALSINAESLEYIGCLAVLAGGALTFDWAFAITRKYTNWMAFSYELGVDKAAFNVAFLKFYMDVENEKELTQDDFAEARALAQDTVKEFKEKRCAETKEWANHLQSVMQALRKSNQQLTTDLKTASAKAAEKRDKQMTETRNKKVKVGLSIKILASADRTSDPHTCVIVNEEAGHEEDAMLKAKPGGSVSVFLSRGRYTVRLTKDGAVIATTAVSLDADKSISL